MSALCKIGNIAFKSRLLINISKTAAQYDRYFWSSNSKAHWQFSLLGNNCYTQICENKRRFSDEAARSKNPDVEGTIFSKIISKDIPADIIYEDDKCLAFRDINPAGPVHFLVIPRHRIVKLADANETHKELLGHLMLVGSQLAAKEPKMKDGFRVVINNGPNALMSVYHLHLHFIGGRKMSWPPG